ncbi:MAG: exonuclease SbcCD subunit D [Oscillospiraceae bacterium]|nr:exonuclease SbcCD subunit D [Oscillospiraceae bacterium]
MKFLHLADLHLGKRMNDYSLLDDQMHALQQVVAMAKTYQVDAVLLAGDIYQKASPPSEAMAAFDQFLQDLTALQIKVFLISGNHDSDTRISYFSTLIRHAGVYASQQFDGTLQQIPVEDDHGTVIIHLLPFIKPAHVKAFYPDEPIHTYEDAVRCVLANSPMQMNARHVLLAHQFIIGAECCDSEVNAVGGLDQISASLFDAFDYVALGHIHKPQQIRRETMRYAGSLLKYSFSEANHHKSVCLVEMNEMGNVNVTQLPLIPLHDVREIEGNLAQLIRADYSEDYVHIILHDEVVPPDARISLLTVFPNMMKFSIHNSRTSEEIDVLAKDHIDDKSIRQLFCDFYMLQNHQQSPPESHLDVLDEILLKLEEHDE